MASRIRVFNVTTRCYVSISQAEGWVDNCVYEWVSMDETNCLSIRKLELAEMLARRAEQAKESEPLPFAELPGLVYVPPQRAEASTREEYRLAVEANKFAAECAV